MKKGFALPILLLLASVALIIGAFFLLDNKPGNSIQNPTQRVLPLQESKTTSTAIEIPPKIDFKLPNGWEFVKSEDPIINKNPLWYRYGEINNFAEKNTSASTPQDVNNEFIIKIFYYQDSSGIQNEGIHDGGGSMLYEKPEQLTLGEKNFIRQLSYAPNPGRNYEGDGYHSPDNKVYSYSYSIDKGFIVVYLYFNINNFYKEKLFEDFNTLISSIVVNN